MRKFSPPFEIELRHLNGFPVRLKSNKNWAAEYIYSHVSSFERKLDRQMVWIVKLPLRLLSLKYLFNFGR